MLRRLLQQTARSEPVPARHNAGRARTTRSDAAVTAARRSRREKAFFVRGSATQGEIEAMDRVFIPRKILHTPGQEKRQACCLLPNEVRERLGRASDRT